MLTMIFLKFEDENKTMINLAIRRLICITVVAIIISYSLTSCSALASTTPVDDIATAVAATLTAQPTRTTLPTATSIPSPTSILPPTPTASHTPTPGPSPTATAPPLPPGDPREGLNLSLPDYKDSFDTNTTWGGPNHEAAVNMIKDGYLEAIDNLTDTYVWWSTTLQQGSNIYAEVTAEILSCSGKDSAGLGVRIQGEFYDSGYTLEVSCDGYYRLRKFSSGVVETLIDWTFSNEIIQGPNASNVIGLVARSSELHATINRTVVGSTEDYSYYSGTFALYANALETPGLTVRFDEFELWYF
jgi:hypothetical protein